MKLFIKTYGCSLNQADSIIMRNLLSGFDEAGSEADADIIIVNTCAVKEPTENKILKYLNELPKDKKVIITGCLTSVRTGLLRRKFEHSLISCDNIFDVPNVVKGLMKDSLGKKKKSKINVVPIRKNEVIEIIPVCQGCLGECTYCTTKLARGELYSYKKKDVIAHVRKALNRGVKEFWFTAQDLGAYGKDINTNIIELVGEVVKIKGFFKIRLGMMNPCYAYKFREGLAGLLNHEKVFKFAHLPVQSGSDKILRLMKRKYSREEFLELCAYLRSRVKGLTISTDVIIGFPTETEADFKQTLSIIKRVKPEVLNLSRFWKRKGTPASIMKQLSVEVVKKRVKTVEALHKSISLKLNKEYQGKFLKVLFDEVNKGRTDSYKIVYADGMLGDYSELFIHRVTSSSLFGKVL